MNYRGKYTFGGLEGQYLNTGCLKDRFDCIYLFFSLCVENDVAARLAFFSDGDARIALNSLETVLRAATGDMKDTPGKGKVVTVDDIKVGLERSHVQYDRAGE